MQFSGVLSRPTEGSPVFSDDGFTSDKHVYPNALDGAGLVLAGYIPPFVRPYMKMMGKADARGRQQLLRRLP